MACCAFAAFLIGQIVFGLRAFWSRLRGVDESAEAVAFDRAAAWSPTGATVLPPVARRAVPLGIAALGIVELAILAGGGFVLTRPADQIHDVAIFCHAGAVRTALLGHSHLQGTP